MKAIGKVAMGGGAGTALLAPALAALLVALAGRDVLVIAPHSPEMVEANRALWTAGQPVAEIYGNPQGRERILFADRAKLIVPEEDGSLMLLAVDKQAGDNPLQAQTVWFFTKWAVLAALAAAVAGAALVFWKR